MLENRNPQDAFCCTYRHHHGRNFHTVIRGQERLTTFRRTNYEYEKTKNGILLTSVLWGLGELYQELGNLSSAKVTYQQIVTASLETCADLCYTTILDKSGCRL